jgi:hypothetical protein
MQKTLLQIAVASVLGVSATAASAVTITWSDGLNDGQAFPSTINASPFSTTPAFPPPNPRNSEFRMIDPGGVLGGGGQKSIFDGGETWTFNSGGAMTGVTGTPLNPGAFAGAAPTPGTNSTLGQNAPFFGPQFNFLANTTSSLAGAAYGPATISFTSGDNFTIFFSTLEAQWGGTYFPLAAVSLGCTGATSGSIRCTGEHTILAANGEDPGAAGFNNWTAQFDLRGSMTPHTPAIPVPAAAWLFGSGLLGLVGVARRRKSA